MTLDDLDQPMRTFAEKMRYTETTNCYRTHVGGKEAGGTLYGP